jgi:hypothetical protein
MLTRRADETVYPPVRALNQMIQACVLISDKGPTIALDLFEQAVSKNKSK